MLQISKKCTVIYLMIIMSLSSCNNNLSITPTQEETGSPATTNATPPFLPTTEMNQEWFGMQISSDQWQMEEIQNDLYQHGLLTHRTLTGCRAWIMSEDPVYVSGYTPDWDTSTHEQFNTAETRIDLWRMKDQNGDLKDIYFEVYDTTGQKGFDTYRLAYFLVETGENPNECLEAIQTVLITLKPDVFPNLVTSQG